MKIAISVVLCGVLSAVIALPATNNDAKEEKAVMATLDAMVQALVKKDIATLNKIFTPDLIYTHSRGTLQNKDDVLKAAERIVTESEIFHDNTIRIHENVALVRAITELRNGTPGDMHDNHLNILWVLVKGPGPDGWQIMARQASRLPENK
jgi:ketosteroid isomerase-like protein